MTKLATAEEFAQVLGELPPPATLSQDQAYVKGLIEEKKLNTSQTIRYLNAEGWATKRIAKAMPAYEHGGAFRYQHVRNVLNQQLKKTS